MCGAHRRNDLDHSCRRRASCPCCLAQNRLTCPCQAQNAKSRRRRAARAQRTTDNARRRWSPDPTDALAHRNSPRAGPRSLPSSAWIGFALLYCRLPEKGTKMKPWGAAMSDDQDKDDGVEAAALSVDDPTRGYPMVPVAPRSALPIARAIDGHQRRRIGGRHFEFEFDLT